MYGIVRLLGSTVNMTFNDGAFPTSDQGSRQCPASGPGGSGECRISNPVSNPVGPSREPPWVAEWDRREKAAAAGEFRQVVNVRNAATLSSKFQTSACKALGRNNTRTPSGGVIARVIAYVRAAADLPPAAASEQIEDLRRTLGVKGGTGYPDPYFLDIDFTPTGHKGSRPGGPLGSWVARRLIQGVGGAHRAWEAVPSLHAVSMWLSRVVPGADGVVMRFVRTTPVCVTAPIPGPIQQRGPDRKPKRRELYQPS